MNAIKQAAWLFFAIALLACSSWYFTNSKKLISLDNDILSNTIDTTITQLTVSQFNSEGVLINLLTTPLMEHIPKDDIHLLRTPHIIIHQDDQPAWEINSKRAKSFEGGKRITFIEQVVVHQNPGDKTQESTLKTEEVTYYPKEKKATTDLFVTFEQPGNIIQSTGMNAYLDEKRVELLHQARGRYEPAKG
ncbi:LPS export ABC transporter periplasmic protein LptC [Legionella sp. km535]|uniref:LPS export ABC transporter periplasmic protein LptC n=1 Tax=Legionella sp. km535 TaxID=2498107 RepID=UPI000F8ED2E7|nr:LPS export ABC transporter periplasmic protein LptC [Legionella sp. km535]RUR16894.1 LPS export ABC transporter periplasmic protein LptC [Legionella sp. km535]